jgi:Mg-chelatase subunit ChlD
MQRVLPLLLVLSTLLLARVFGPSSSLAQQDPLQASTKTVNVELILDASGSMAETLPDGETRMDAAKRILRQVITDLPEREGVNVGLRVYGHQGDNTQAGRGVSCRASELLVPVSGVDKAALIAEVDAIQPTGWTPIAHSLEQAAADFQPGGESITNAIVLVTDGEETCDPPERACQAAAALHQAGISVTTHVVGFALTDQQTTQVRCIAEQGGGQLFGADNAQQLGSALSSAMAATGVSGTPLPLTPVAATSPLADIRTLAYHQLTSWTTGANDRGEEAPILSDDGQRIAFARAPGAMGDPANPNRIFVMNADGSGEREVDVYPPLCNCGALIDLSADGSRIVSSDAMQVRVAEAVGDGGRQQLALDSNEINVVRISGDGRTIVFRIYRDTTVRGTSPSEPIQRGIYTINPDGSELRQLVGPDDIASILSVTPDQVGFFGASSGVDVSANSAQIVFAMFVPAVAGGGSGEGLFAVTFDGSGLRTLVDDTNVTATAISGDGSRVAFVTYTGATGRQQAGVLAVDGSEQRILTDNTSFHPGTGGNLPSGERIQLSMDGSRLLLGSTGLLYDTNSGQVLALGVGAPGVPADHAPLVIDGLNRATMDAAATRALYLFQPVGQPLQLVRLDLNPADLGGAPTITDGRVDPAFVLTETRSNATISARVSGGDNLWVGSRVLREGLPDDNVETSYRGPLVDDGTVGDAAAGDDLFSNNTLTTNCCAELRPRAVRVKAETQAADGLQHATAVDVTPFAVTDIPLEGGPSPATPLPPTLPPSPTVAPPTATAVPPPTATSVPPTPPPPTPIPPSTVTAGLTPTGPGTGDMCNCEDLAAAQATIAAQATHIAELESGNPPTPPPVTTPEVPSSPTPTPTGVGPTTPPSTDFMTPDPEECTLTPRTAEELAALAATPDQAATDALAAARIDAALTVPEGAPADAATMAAVLQTYRLMVACFNAGNDLAAYALWSDKALRQIQAQPPTGEQTPVPEEERSAFRVTEVRLLPDGRVAAVWEERTPLFATTLVQVLTRQGDRYLVDETLDATLASDSNDALEANS